MASSKSDTITCQVQDAMRAGRNILPARIVFALSLRLAAAVGAYDGRLLAAFARHPEHGIVAGVSGYTWARFCEVQLLWVHADLRGQGYGSRLLAMAEEEARARGCGLVTLGSYTFQAPGFYQRHGYQVVGTVPDCPPGHAHVFLMKVL
jgi:GNAT superfamily N-acetyltransferase